MKSKNVYYQGEDIVVRISGSERIDLDESDWMLAIAKAGSVELIEKEDCERLEENQYRAVISRDRTSQMSVGMYDVELSVRGESVSIAVAKNVLLIEESVFGDGRS
jgi:hypothetical protein